MTLDMKNHMLYTITWRLEDKTTCTKFGLFLESQKKHLFYCLHQYDCIFE